MRASGAMSLLAWPGGWGLRVGLLLGVPFDDAVEAMRASGAMSLLAWPGGWGLRAGDNWLRRHVWPLPLPSSPVGYEGPAKDNPLGPRRAYDVSPCLPA